MHQWSFQGGAVEVSLRAEQCQGALSLGHLIPKPSRKAPCLFFTPKAGVDSTLVLRFAISLAGPQGWLWSEALEPGAEQFSQPSTDPGMPETSTGISLTREPALSLSWWWEDPAGHLSDALGLKDPGILKSSLTSSPYLRNWKINKT